MKHRRVRIVMVVIEIIALIAWIPCSLVLYLNGEGWIAVISSISWIIDAVLVAFEIMKLRK